MEGHNFKETYKEMPFESLMDLTVEMDDLVPEAKFALLAELMNRGKTKDDIAQYGLTRKGGLPPEADVSQQVSQNHGTDCGCGHVCGDSHLMVGPVPHDWSLIPQFGFEESLAILDFMEKRDVQARMSPSSTCGAQQFFLAVPKGKLKDSIEALKEFFELTDKPADLFAGQCPACGTEQSGVKECAECGIVLSQDSWEANQSHPFVKYLFEKGLGGKT